MLNIELAKPRDFGEIINDTFLFIRQNFKPLLKYFFIFSGFFILASSATTVLIQIKAIGMVNNFNPNSFEGYNGATSLLSFYVNLLLTLLFIMLEYLSITVTVLCYMTLYKQKRNTIPTAEEMWGYFKFYFLKALFSSILLYIIIAIGTMLCIIPGIYLYPIMMLVLPIMIVENTSFGYAFNQSFRLIKDNWWATFGVLVIVFIIIYVASLLVAVPSALLNAGNFFVRLNSKTPVTLPVAIITTILQEVSHVFHIITVVAIGLCYFNLSESKEGTSLNERISQFGTGGPDTNPTPEEY